MVLQEEIHISKIINHLTGWKFLLPKHDNPVLVQNCSNRLGKVSMFKDNCPRYDWIQGFKAHHTLSKQMVSNAIPTRAENDRKMIYMLFKNFSEVTENVAPCNIVNYDEMITVDDPGIKQCIVHHGLQTIEQKISHSKQLD